MRTRTRKETIKRRFFCFGLAGLFLTASFSVDAQQTKKIHRIGYLTGGSLSALSDRAEAFRHGLRELGYVEGKNIVIEWRGADGNRERQRSLAAELVRLKLDVIVTGGSTSTRSAKGATSTIPIVMTQDSDPVGTGIIASLAQPGGNVTGLTRVAPDLMGKRLEILKALIPVLSRVAVFGSSTSAGDPLEIKEIERAAGALKVELHYADVLTFKDIEPAFRAAVNGRSEAALMMISGTVSDSRRNDIAALAVKYRLPTIHNTKDFVEAGGLMSYGINAADLERRAATYVDKILKGAKPAELPVEQPTKFESVINLRAAKQIGLTIPPNVLARADKVIK